MNWIKYILTLLLLYFGMGARADNIVTIGTAEGAPGDEVTVSIGLQNTDAVSSLQVLIPLDQNLSYVDGSAAFTGRCGNHNITAGVKDGMLSLMIYSMSLTAIGGNEGEVANFRLKLGSQPTDITLAVSKAILTDTGGNSMAAPSTKSGSISIRCAKAQYSTMSVDFGRVPIRSTYHQSVLVTNIGNEPLTITGLQFSVYPTRFSSDTTFPLIVAAGSSAGIDIKYEPDVRGTVTETVKVVCNSVSKLNNIALKAQPFAVNELHIQPAEGISDETVTVSLTMNNMDAISGFQFEFTLPEALTYVPNSFTLSERKKNHSIVESQTNGVLRILCYSPDDTPFVGEDGELATMQLKLTGRNSTDLKLSKCLLTATIENQVTDVCSADYGATVTIRSPRISASNSLSMGKTPVTVNAEKELTINNYGNAPLTISRVVFDKEGFSIKESLPLTIDTWGNKVLTVVYPSKGEGDFSTTMHIYSNDPEQRLWDVDVTGNRFAPNYLSVNVSDVYSNENLSIDISLDTYDAINGIQFDVVYPGSYYTTFEGNYTLEPRAEGMSVTMRQIDKNTLRFFCFFLSGKGIDAGEGKIMNLLLNPASQNVPLGDYSVRLENIMFGTGDLSDKYAGTSTQSAFTVKGDASLNVKAKSYTREYGAANPTFEYETNGNLNGTPEVICNATVLSPVGEYPILIRTGSVSNENVSYTNGVLTITKAPLIVSTGNYTKKQGEANPDFALSYEGFKNNETEKVLKSKPIASTSAIVSSMPGVYDIVISGGEADNYEISYTNGKLTVTEADPIKLTAKNYTREYGDDNPIFEYSVEGATLDGEPEIICEATATSPVGEYPIIIKKGSVSNYNDTYINGTLTITKAHLSIAAKSYSMKQGDALPVFDVTYSGFKNDETKDVLTKQPTISCEATSATAPGKYDLVVGGAEAQNYEISYTNGILTIIEAEPVKVTAKSYTISYGDAIPEFEYTSEGKVLEGTPAISCEATSTSPVGTYPIVISKGSVTNYNDSYVNGVLTITKAPLKISVGNYEKKQYDPMPDFSVQFEGFKNNETKDVLTKQPTVSCEANEDSAPGEYAIVVDGAEAVNYQIQYVAGKLTVTEPDSYTLTYMVDGEVYQSFSIKYRDVITPLAVPIKKGYTFSGWSEIPATMPAKNVTVTGSFAVNSYSLTYMVDGEVYKTSPIPYGTTLTPESDPTKEGYTFSGWSEIPSTMPAEDVTVIGSFSINKYKLIYKVDGADYKTIEVEYGSTITVEAEPTKEGYTFSGWSEIPATMPAKDVTVTGTFSINKYKLIYKVDGTDYKTVEVEYGAKIIPEADPTKEGYTFSGWSEIPSTMPAKDVTVTGTFTINSYTLTYMVDGEVYQSFTVKYKEAITPIDAPKKEGYTFSGWDGLPRSMPAKDVIVKGYFTINSYTITYVLDGEVYTTETLEYGAKIVPPVIPGLEDYTIWEDVPATMPASDITVNGKAKDIIDSLTSVFSRGEGDVYDSNGRKLPALQKGLNIIRMKDGTVKKIIFK